MKTMAKWTMSALVTIPLLCTTAFADTNTTNGAQLTGNVAAQQRFEAKYAQNQAAETALLQQANQVQTADSSQYQAFVTALGTQVSTLYATEVTLAALQPPHHVNKEAGLLKQEQGLKAKLQADLSIGKKDPAKTPKQRKALAKLKSETKQLTRTIAKLDATLRVLLKSEQKKDRGGYQEHIETLKVSILGLQAEEIHETKAWIASGQSTVTGSVYGSTNATVSTGGN